MGNEFGHPEWIDFPRGDSYDNSTGAFVPGKPDTPLPEKPDIALLSVTLPFLSTRHYVTPPFRVKGPFQSDRGPYSRYRATCIHPV